MYWNQEAFESLQRIAQELREDPDLRHFAEYCSRRDQGLRGDALGAIANLLQEFGGWDPDKQQAVAARLCQLQHRHQHAHLLAPHPLQQYLAGVMRKWVARDPLASAPHRRLGMLTGDAQESEAAVALDPSDHVARASWASIEIAWLEYVMHELPSGLLADVDEVRRCLQRASELINALPREPKTEALAQRLDALTGRLRAWLGRSTDD